MSSLDNMKIGQVRVMISVLLVGLMVLMSAGPIMAEYSGNFFIACRFAQTYIL